MILQWRSPLVGAIMGGSSCLGPSTSGASLFLPHKKMKMKVRKKKEEWAFCARKLRRPIRSPCSISSSLGFTAEPRVGIERAANGILRDAASLLVYQEVLRSPPAQAFLKLILALRRGEDGWKLLEAYGEFFKLMAIGCHSSWEDFILDGILAGEGNPFAEAAANVGNPRSNWSRGIPPSLRAAAAVDLDTLQRLSITESTLVGWVTELSTDVKAEWRAAAESSLSCRNMKTGASSIVEKYSHMDGEEISDLNVEFGGLDDSIMCAERESWRKRIGGLWKWSEAVPLLEDYYHSHSIGKLMFAQALQYKGGKLLSDDKFCAKIYSGCKLRIYEEHYEALLQNFKKHASGFAAHNVIVSGPSGSGKSWLVKSVLRSLAENKEIRVVSLSRNELKNYGAVLEDLSKYWQLRFVVLIDNLHWKVGDDNYSFLVSILEEAFQVWPKNVLLCVTSPNPSEHIPNESNKLCMHGTDLPFCMTLKTQELDFSKGMMCAEDVLLYDKSTNKWHYKGMEAEIRREVEDRLSKSDVLSLRELANFLNSFI